MPLTHQPKQFDELSVIRIIFEDEPSLPATAQDMLEASRKIRSERPFHWVGSEA
jgi:hypothetical protein